MRLPKAVIVCVMLLTACGSHGVQAQGTPDSDTWATDVIGVSEMHLSAEYWLEQIPEAGLVLASPQDIAAFNRNAFSADENMVDLEQFPDELPAQDIKTKILSVSKPYHADLYDEQGTILGPDTYEKHRANLNLDSIPDIGKTRFALAVRRADMRTYPTDERYYRSRDSKNLDRFQENGVFPGDALAVLHESKDGEWLFVQSYNYPAWIKKQDLAFADRPRVFEYRNTADFLMVTGDKISTSFNPEVPQVSELQLDMGVRVPRAPAGSRQNDIYGQNPYASHIVQLPVRDENGQLDIKLALIPRNKDVHVGYLPYTRENITRQAFKFLGERYGWGHSFNARDCTGFVSEVYKTFGIAMPRNSGQQGASSIGINTRFTPENTTQEKLGTFPALDSGDLIYIPGHVMMFIGNVDGQPYVIHDVSGLNYIDENGEYYNGVLNGVSVTPLIPLRVSQETTYVDKVYNIKKIR